MTDLPSESLDAAWAEAEAALPDAWELSVGGSFGHPAGKYEATADPPRGNDGRAGYGATPAAALHALATRLRARSDDWGYVLKGPAIFGEEPA